MQRDNKIKVLEDKIKQMGQEPEPKKFQKSEASGVQKQKGFAKPNSGNRGQS